MDLCDLGLHKFLCLPYGLLAAHDAHDRVALVLGALVDRYEGTARHAKGLHCLARLTYDVADSALLDAHLVMRPVREARRRHAQLPSFCQDHALGHLGIGQGPKDPDSAGSVLWRVDQNVALGELADVLDVLAAPANDVADLLLVDLQHEGGLLALVRAGVPGAHGVAGHKLASLGRPLLAWKAPGVAGGRLAHGLLARGHRLHVERVPGDRLHVRLADDGRHWTSRASSQLLLPEGLSRKAHRELPGHACRVTNARAQSRLPSRKLLADDRSVKAHSRLPSAELRASPRQPRHRALAHVLLRAGGAGERHGRLPHDSWT
mmetsp:Transcript_112391/g.362924  ORF Transcript_112391/g.362924 Transcript_112391/m.362924 type:complete len:320 (-) Transcript_112391:351-1310(-)